MLRDRCSETLRLTALTVAVGALSWLLLVCGYAAWFLVAWISARSRGLVASH